MLSTKSTCFDRLEKVEQKSSEAAGCSRCDFCWKLFVEIDFCQFYQTLRKELCLQEVHKSHRYELQHRPLLLSLALHTVQSSGSLVEDACMCSLIMHASRPCRNVWMNDAMSSDLFVFACSRRRRTFACSKQKRAYLHIVQDVVL